MRAVLESIEAPARDELAHDYSAEETRRLVQSVLDRLPSRYGDVLEWKYIEGLSVEERAHALVVGETAARFTMPLKQYSVRRRAMYSPLCEGSRLMSTHDDTASNGVELAELLRETGTRDQATADVMREGEAAMRAEWRQVVAARQRRRAIVFAAAAAVGALAIGTTIGLQQRASPEAPIARLQRSDGEIFIAGDASHWTRLNDGQEISVGAHLRSDARAALQFDTGLAVRVDRGTAMHIAAADRLALKMGALYVDAPPGKSARPLRIDTKAASVRHLGTQYQVRADASGIEVSVREGRIVIDNPSGSSVASAGERVRVSLRGTVQRNVVSPVDDQWQWASEIAPMFVIEAQPLSMFLTWVARETGRTLIYDSPEAQSAAESVTLHGTIEGLAPDVALTAVLTTTPLHRRKTRADVLEISASAD